MAHPHSRYLDIAAELRRRITSGEWEPGSTLPRLADLAEEYGVNRDTMGRAIAVLEAEGLVWAVARRGTIVRHGMVRPRRTRGNIVRRNLATDSLGYSFPSATSQEVWHHSIPPTAGPEKLTDPRLARLLSVPEGTEVMRRVRVTGPVTEPPFQIATTWIHPRIAQEVPQVTELQPGPVSSWLYHVEKAGHWPISWTEFHRARMPSQAEASMLQIPLVLPVLEIVRVGRSGSDDKPVEVTEYVIPADRVETVQTLHRDESATSPWPDQPGE